jgi:hypothetical protein
VLSSTAPKLSYTVKDTKASVVSLGAITEFLGAPIWLIVLIPFPVGMFLLYLILNKPQKITISKIFI